MAWGADLIAVRGWIADAVQSVWPGVTVAVDAPEKTFGSPFARVATKELKFESDSVLVDRLEAVFEIRVRRAVEMGIVADVLMADAEYLRAELLAELNPAGVAELPTVNRVWIEQGSPGDEEFEMRLEFSCMICAERGN